MVLKTLLLSRVNFVLLSMNSQLRTKKIFKVDLLTQVEL